MRDIQCAHCGHYFNSDHPYFSEDFARAFLEGVNIGISWCLHCGHVSEYRQKKVLFVKLPSLGLTGTYPILDLKDKDYFGAPFGRMGGLFGFQVLRMIWHSVNARAKIESGPAHTPITTLRELLVRVHPFMAAMAILAVSNTNQSLQLEEQIQFAVYSSEIDWGFVDEMRKLLEGDAELPNKEIALDVLNEASKKVNK